MKTVRLLAAIAALTLLLVGATLITRADGPTPTPTSTPSAGAVGQGLPSNKPCYEALDQRCVPEPTVTPTPEPVPPAPTLNPIGNYGPGAFTVTWNAVPYGVTYELVESTDQVNWTDVYRGPATSWTPTNHTDGTFYYKVNAHNHRGVYWGGPWSNIQKAVVIPWMPAGPRVHCANVGPTTIRCRIDEPYVKQPMTSYYPYVMFQPGDVVQVDAGGCVQRGGSGDTWKRYVDPDPMTTSNHPLYRGTIWIPGATVSEADTIGSWVNAYTLPHFMRIPSTETDPRNLYLRLGYRDDHYDDNGYYAHDDGTTGQCKGAPNAFVIVQIDRGTAHPTPLPFTGWWPKIESFQAMPDHVPAGGSTTLMWQVRECEPGCDIRVKLLNTVLGNHLPATGSLVVHPASGATEYTLEVSKPSVGTATKHTTVYADAVTGPPLPDLYIPYNDTDPTFPKAGLPFTVKFTVCNAGGAPSGPFIMHMWRDANDDGHTKDIDEPSFAPGHCEDITWEQASLPPDGYVFSALVDWTNVVNEASEANNQSEMYLGLVAP